MQRIDVVSALEGTSARDTGVPHEAADGIRRVQVARCEPALQPIEQLPYPADAVPEQQDEYAIEG